MTVACSNRATSCASGGADCAAEDYIFHCAAGDAGSNECPLGSSIIDTWEECKVYFEEGDPSTERGRECALVGSRLALT